MIYSFFHFTFPLLLNISCFNIETWASFRYERSNLQIKRQTSKLIIVHTLNLLPRLAERANNGRSSPFPDPNLTKRLWRRVRGKETVSDRGRKKESRWKLSRKLFLLSKTTTSSLSRTRSCVPPPPSRGEKWRGQRGRKARLGEKHGARRCVATPDRGTPGRRSRRVEKFVRRFRGAAPDVPRASPRKLGKREAGETWLARAICLATRVNIPPPSPSL